jgi:hypothetical protein
MGLALLGLVVSGINMSWAESPAALTTSASQKAQMTQSDVREKVTTAKKTGTEVKTSKVRQLTGTIEAITDRQLRLKKGEEVYTFSITGETKLKMDAPKNKITDLKMGNKVMTKYTEENGVMIARSISLKADK